MSEPNQSASSPQTESKPPVVLDARQLLQGRREVVIEHEGVRYRLRLTRRNKLLLQK